MVNFTAGKKPVLTRSYSESDEGKLRLQLGRHRPPPPLIGLRAPGNHPSNGRGMRDVTGLEAVLLPFRCRGLMTSFSAVIRSICLELNQDQLRRRSHLARLQKIERMVDEKFAKEQPNLNSERVREEKEKR
ncbi:hypothetical protein HELRODRAFT_194355 [Helobdella robusta]|uniref:Uncharacterized protein n=1 Tax=Helobdella robusta TaxID=6412 RepID=T1FVZ1_HELRO|nr:hypothetical protein HELRODRAFT_194355 [Helobdella robusta]ESN92214.1 hypothetical protein HELRODRAFT_194355 [Helobdella robusta]